MRVTLGWGDHGPNRLFLLVRPANTSGFTLGQLRVDEVVALEEEPDAARAEAFVGRLDEGRRRARAQLGVGHQPIVT